MSVRVVRCIIHATISKEYFRFITEWPCVVSETIPMLHMKVGVQIPTWI